MVRRSHLIALVALAAAGLAFATVPASASAPCTWNAAADFRFAPDNANPSPDQCGHAGVWSYLSGDASHAVATYVPLAGYTSVFAGHPDAQSWCYTQSGDSCDLPIVEKNNGDTFTSGTPIVRGHEMLVHPGTTRPVIIAWTSPIHGTVRVTGDLHSDDFSGGSGIAWFVDDGATTLAAGSYGMAGSQAFQDGSGADALTAIDVSPGDVLYLIVDPHNDYTYDSTGVNLTIRELAPSTPTPELPTLALAGIGLTALVVVIARRVRED